MVPYGSSTVGLIVWILLFTVPILTALLAVAFFQRHFYAVHHNIWGLPTTLQGYSPLWDRSKDRKSDAVSVKSEEGVPQQDERPYPPVGWPEVTQKRRTVLIATLEYEIFDWQIKVKSDPVL